MKFWRKFNRKEKSSLFILFAVWAWMIFGAAGDFGSSVDEIDSLSEQKLVSYQVQGNVINAFQVHEIDKENKKLLQEQEDQDKHDELWGYFKQLVPEEYRQNLVGFDIGTDGLDGTWAEVYQSYEDPQNWILAIDPQDFYLDDELYLEDLLGTMVHELGHLISLDSDQIYLDDELYYLWKDGSNWDYWDYYDELVAKCSTYFPGEGCSKRNSYINDFYQEFWLDKYDENLEIWNIIDEDEFEDEMYDFYLKYEDEFVDDYAAYNPAEDFAETFMYFVLEYQDYDEDFEIIREKIDFFYQYPELVEMKNQIYENYWEIWDQE